MPFPTFVAVDAYNAKQTLNSTPLAGQATMANSLPVVLASDQTTFNVAIVSGGTGGGAITVADGADVSLGAKADAAWTTGAGSIIALLKALDRDTLLPLPTGANVIGGVTQSGNWTVGGALLMPTATFTTTALTTAWTSNQLIANNATAGSVVPLTFANAVRVAGGTGSIRRAQIQVASDTGFAGQSLVLALYTVSPTFASGDRATWLTSFSGFIGQIAVTLSQHFSDYEQGIGVPVNGSELNFACAGGSTTIYGVVVSAGTLTPQAASRAIIASLEILAN